MKLVDLIIKLLRDKEGECPSCPHLDACEKADALCFKRIQEILEEQ